VRAGARARWRPLLAALEAEAGFDPVIDEVESEGNHLEIRATFKGFSSSYHLSNFDFHTDGDPHAEAQAIAVFMREAQALRVGPFVAPLESLLPRHRLMQAIMSHHGIDDQATLDRIWSSRLDLASLGKAGGRFRWATEELAPEIMATKKTGHGREIQFVTALGNTDLYLCGDLLSEAWQVDTAVLSDTIVLTIEGKSVVASFRDQLPETVMDGIVGRPLSDVVTHPAVDHLDITVTKVRRRGGLTAVWLGGTDIRKGWPSVQRLDPQAMGELPQITAAWTDLQRTRWR